MKSRRPRPRPRPSQQPRARRPPDDPPPLLVPDVERLLGAWRISNDHLRNLTQHLERLAEALVPILERQAAEVPVEPEPTPAPDPPPPPEAA